MIAGRTEVLRRSGDNSTFPPGKRLEAVWVAPVRVLARPRVGHADETAAVAGGGVVWVNGTSLLEFWERDRGSFSLLF